MTSILLFEKTTALPADLNGVPFSRWHAPTTIDGWRAVPEQRPDLKEPAMPKAPGKKLSAGTVILEPDRRIWIREPKGHFGGYQQTFAKGTLDVGLTLQQTAIKETREEMGLQVAIGAHLVDTIRDTSVARFYLARRTGGRPIDFDHETDAVRLVDWPTLGSMVNHKNDQPVLAALKALLTQPN